VSSGTDAGEADITNSRQRILDFNVISKLLAVDTEVDPPQQNRRHIRHRVVFPREMTMNLFLRHNRNHIHTLNPLGGVEWPSSSTL